MESQSKWHDLNMEEELDILELYDTLPKISQRNAGAQLKIYQSLMYTISKNRCYFDSCITK